VIPLASDEAAAVGVDQTANELLRPVLDDVLLPVAQGDTAGMLAARAVLREQRRPQPRGRHDACTPVRPMAAQRRLAPDHVLDRVGREAMIPW
jgi:hypothetical protein